jgi:N4-gp56 family major capsid protein
MKIGQDFRFLQNTVEHNTDLVGTLDFGVRLFYENSVLDITQTKTEGAERTFTEMTNLGFVDAAIVFYQGAIVISKEIASTSHTNLVDYAKYAIVQATEKDIEGTIVTETETASNNIVFGGDAVSVATLETGDIMTANVWADARTSLRADNFEPAVGYMAAEQEGQLTKDSQFVNVAEYGGREVVLNGEVGKFLGTKMITTTNVNAKTNSGDSWGVDGHLCFMYGKNPQGKWPITLVWKEKPVYSMEFLKRWNNHYIYVDAAWDVELVQDSGVVLMAVTDA